jgi:hypothetical protein
MGLWNKIKKAAKATVSAIVDAVERTVVPIVEDAVGVVTHGAKALWEAATGHPDRAKRELRRMFDSARRLASDVTLGVLGAAVMVAVVLVSGVQRVFGAQNEPRRLTDQEIALLRDIFRDALDYDEIRVVENRLGILDGGRWGKAARRAPYTIGYTIYVPGATLNADTLVHEAVHVWQFEHGGPRYILSAVRAQKWGQVGTVPTCPSHAPTRGYDFDNALTDGRRWPEFNPEQQAAFIEYGHCYDPAHSLFLTLTGSLFVPPPALPLPPPPQPPPPPPPGAIDYMPNFIAAVTAVRAGNGAAW